MSGRRWVRVATCDQIPLREGRAVTIGDREIAVFNLGDRHLALDNKCPHRGGPLCDGIVTGSSVVCPLHGWKASLETGAIERPRNAVDHCVNTYATRVEDGVVAIELPEGGRESFVEDSPTAAISVGLSSTNDSRPLSAGRPSTNDSRPY